MVRRSADGNPSGNREGAAHVFSLPRAGHCVAARGVARGQTNRSFSFESPDRIIIKLVPEASQRRKWAGFTEGLPARQAGGRAADRDKAGLPPDTSAQPKVPFV